MLPVVYVIFIFKHWYILGDVSSHAFMNSIKLFLLGILIFLMGMLFIILLRWELIGIISFVLISWWWRFDALAGSISAVIYNRFGDVALMLWVIFVTSSWFFLLILFLAVLGKSSQSLQSYWLPIAIEGPTPVSSLLHSSTMVVAGVFFSLLLGWLWLVGIFRFLSLLFISLSSLSFYDIKKIVAFSTSCHLSLILSYLIVFPSMLILHIITHGFVKRPIFILSGIWIHFVGSQDLRLNSTFFGYHVNILMLMGFGIRFIINSKEFLLFGGDMFLFVLILYVVVSLRYSSTSIKQGSHISFGGYGILVCVFVLLILALSGIISVCLLDSGINWLLLCFFLSLIPFISDMNSNRFVHKW